MNLGELKAVRIYYNELYLNGRNIAEIVTDMIYQEKSRTLSFSLDTAHDNFEAHYEFLAARDRQGLTFMRRTVTGESRDECVGPMYGTSGILKVPRQDGFYQIAGGKLTPVLDGTLRLITYFDPVAVEEKDPVAADLFIRQLTRLEFPLAELHVEENTTASSSQL